MSSNFRYSDNSQTRQLASSRRKLAWLFSSLLIFGTACGTEAGNGAIIGVLTVMFVLYYTQAIVAGLMARKTKFNGASVWNVFGSMRFWPAVIATLILPLALSWIPSIPQIHNGYVGPKILEVILYTGSVSLLAILITIEISLLFNNRFSDEYLEWRHLLVAALSLDIISIFIFTVFIGDPLDWEHFEASALSSSLFMGLTFFGALISSFMVIMVIRVVGEPESMTLGTNENETQQNEVRSD